MCVCVCVCVYFTSDFVFESSYTSVLCNTSTGAALGPLLAGWISDEYVSV